MEIFFFFFFWCKCKEIPNDINSDSLQCSYFTILNKFDQDGTSPKLQKEQGRGRGYRAERKHKNDKEMVDGNAQHRCKYRHRM